MFDTKVNIPKTKRGEKTFNKLIEAAENSFYEKGYYGTSIVDITKGAEVGLGTFYVYFEDKLTIYRYLLKAYSYQIRKAISVAIQNEKAITRKEKEEVGLNAFLQFISDNRHIYNIIWESLYIDKSLFIDYYTNFGEYYQKQIIDSQENGELKQFDPEVAAFMLMGISNFVGLNWIMFKNEKNFDYVSKEAIRILGMGMFNNTNE